MKTSRLFTLIGLLVAVASTGWGQIILTGSSGASTIEPGGPSVNYTAAFSGSNLSGSSSGTFQITFGGTSKTIAVPSGVSLAYLELAASNGSLGGAFLDFATTNNYSVTFTSLTAGNTPNLVSQELRVYTGTSDSFSARFLFDITNSAGGNLSFGGVTFTGTYSGASVSTTLTGTVDGFYALATVPEPSTWAWGGTMLSAGLVTLWRRRRAAVSAA